MFQYLKRLAGIAIVPEVKVDTFWRNKGWPPINLTWDDATTKYNSSAWAPPKFCPLCGAKSTEMVSDWWDIEDSGQYMVRTVYCSEGCGFTPWVA
jgi:hypothetical protein